MNFHYRGVKCQKIASTDFKTALLVRLPPPPGLRDVKVWGEMELLESMSCGVIYSTETLPAT